MLDLSFLAISHHSINSSDHPGDPSWLSSHLTTSVLQGFVCWTDCLSLIITIYSFCVTQSNFSTLSNSRPTDLSTPGKS